MIQYTSTPISTFSESPMERVGQSDTTGSASLQMVGELFIWSGSIGDIPNTPQFILRKFPLKNQPNFITPSVKIENTYKFDVSPIIDSYMSASLVDIASEVDDKNKNGVFYALKNYEEFKSGSTTFTSSKDQTAGRPAVSGYWKWGEAQYGEYNSNESISFLTLPKYPFLSTQPITFGDDIQPIYDLTKNIYFSVFAYTNALAALPINNVIIQGNAGSTSTANINSTDAYLSSSLFIFDFTLSNSLLQAFSNAGNTSIGIAARNGTTQIGGTLLFGFECKKKYTPVSVFWRNRFGRYEQFQFNLVSREGLNVERKTYERNPTNQFSNGYFEDIGTTVYSLQGNKNLVVNTDYISEAYNVMFEDMMLSPEIYLQIDPTNLDNRTFEYLNANVRPLTLIDNSLTLKKGEVDKLIQYTFTFNFGNPFKLTY